MNFSEALLHVSIGAAIRRSGWAHYSTVNLEKGLFDFTRTKGDTGGIEGTVTRIQSIPIELFDKGYVGHTTKLPSLRIINGNGNNESYTPSQQDLFAQDWECMKVLDKGCNVTNQEMQAGTMHKKQNDHY